MYCKRRMSSEKMTTWDNFGYSLVTYWQCAYRRDCKDYIEDFKFKNGIKKEAL